MTTKRGLLRRLMLAAGRGGFFIPYRYAGQERAPQLYATLDTAFISARAEFHAAMATMAFYLDAFLAFEGKPPGPRFDQDWFPRLDGAAAYAQVRDRKPARIIEIGSGHSTRFMARAIADGGLSTRLTAIDPSPRATLSGLPVTWVGTTLQDAGTDLFSALKPGDMLVVDSSHILMPGTDVDIVLNDLLPRLPSGVLVHFHDIFLPDQYPGQWSWRGYNEQNAVASLISAGGWQLLWASHFVATRMTDDIKNAGLDRLPLLPGAFESSLWLRKL